VKPVLFNDPFSRFTIERLKFLYLYYDEVHIVDYSALLQDYAKNGWTVFLNEKAISTEIKRKFQKDGIRDRNQIARAMFLSRSESKRVLNAVHAALEKTYTSHANYWNYLAFLSRQGFIHLEPLPEELEFAKQLTRDQIETKLLAEQMSGDLRDWWLDYIARTVPPDLVAEEVRLPVGGLVYLILAAHIFGGIAKQLQGFEVYTGEDAQIRAMSRMVDFAKPTSTRLGDIVISVEVPSIQVKEFHELAEAKAKLTDLRHAFVVEMSALTADLENQEWNDSLLAEIRARKKSKVDPILFDLQRQANATVANMIRDKSGESLDTALGVGSIAMTVALAFGAKLDVGLLAGLVGSGAGSLLGGIARGLSDKVHMDKNHLAYVVKLKQHLD
jgi:hypothetical protein